jgi:hypothetical protein
VGFAGQLLDCLTTTPDADLLAAAKVMFDISDSQITRIIASSESAVSKSIARLNSLAADQFEPDLALANISAGIENRLANDQTPVSSLAKLIFGIKNSIHFQIKEEKLVAKTDTGDLFTINLSSERSVIARCYKNENPITAERDALSSIVEQQVLRQLGTSAICIVPLGRGGVIAYGISQGKVVDETLLRCFQKSVTRHFAQDKPLIELDYVQARVSEVTHEVNNPLAIVQNYLHTLSLKIDENSPV